MTRAELDRALIAAHDAGDGVHLAALYARGAAAETVPKAKAFFLTQAYIFALEAGLPEAETYRAKLVALGADHDA